MQIRKVIWHHQIGTKMVKYWLKNISGKIEAVFFKLGTRNVLHKRNKTAPIVLLPKHKITRCYPTYNCKAILGKLIIIFHSFTSHPCCITLKNINPKQCGNGSGRWRLGGLGFLANFQHNGKIVYKFYSSAVINIL